MLFKSTYIELPRRITAYYFMFGLAALTWLAIGVVFVSTSVLSSRAESSCLTQLGRASSAISIELLRHGKKNLQPLVVRFRTEGSLAYCAIVSEDGRYIAHSSPDLVGQQPSQLTGAVVKWGDIQRIRFMGADSQLMREYRTPLKQAGQVVGSVRLAVSEPGLWGTFGAAAERAPLAILGPMLFMACGAVVLRRLVRPLSDIDGQLRQAATANAIVGVDLKTVPILGPASIGWNRFVDQHASGKEKSRLETHLSEVVPVLRQKKLDEVLNSLSDGIAVTDGEGAITFANQALVALVDAPDTSAIYGQTIPACLESSCPVPADSPILDPELQQRTVVAEIEHTEGMSQCVLRVARHPIRSDHATAGGGHVWTVRDVTQQKLAEEMRNQFVDTATHELRTPLANIKAYAETLVLSEMNDVEQQKDFLNTINSEATRLARFVDDLLSVSSMEVGSLTLTKQEADARRMFNEAIAKVRPQIEQKQITLEVMLPEKMPTVCLDKDKISVTLVNLLSNAVKYTPEGGRVAMRVKATKENLEIDVEDSGMGISEEELPKIFDKFFRSKDPRVQQEAGTGLGLSLAHEIVRLHGGSMTAQSELNKGTKISVTLPLG